MTKQDLKAVYAEGNTAYRIVYYPGGTWALQEYRELVHGEDRRVKQPWVSLNTGMSYDDAIVALGRYAKARA